MKPPAHITEVIAREAASHGIPVELALSLCRWESDFNPQAVSPAGAMGLFQLMPATAKGYGISDPFNVDQNVHAGLAHLKYVYGLFQDWPKAIAAYNWGHGNVLKHPDPADWPPETQNHVRKVLKGWDNRKDPFSPRNPVV